MIGLLWEVLIVIDEKGASNLRCPYRLFKVGLLRQIR